MKRTIVAFATGITVGVVTGILIAPQSGRRTREDIDYAAKKTQRGIDEANWELKNKANQIQRGFRKQIERFDLS